MDLRLILTPYHGISFTIRLEEYKKLRRTKPAAGEGDNTRSSSTVRAIYPSENYNFELLGKDVHKIKEVFFYVNGKFKAGSFRNPELIIKHKADGLPVFNDCVVQCSIQLNIRLNDGKMKSFYAEPLPVITYENEYDPGRDPVKEMLFNISRHIAKNPLTPSNPNGIVQRIHTIRNLMVLYDGILPVFKQERLKEELDASLGFLLQLKDEIDALEVQSEGYVRNIKINEKAGRNKNWTPAYYYLALQEIYPHAVILLREARESVKRIITKYRAFGAKPSPFIPTRSFLLDNRLGAVYTKTRDFIESKDYSIQDERFLNAQVETSEIYENFVIVNILEEFGFMGYNLMEKKYFDYGFSETPDSSREYRRYNYYRFEKDGETYTLYVEPVIHRHPWQEIGFDLIRNNTVRFNDYVENEPEKEMFYCPDFVLKYERGGIRDQYLILDAKYSKLETIQTYYLSTLVFKYMFSISAGSKDSELLGLGVLYGKCTRDALPESCYNLAQNHEIHPLAYYLPLSVYNAKRSLHRIVELLSGKEKAQFIDRKKHQDDGMNIHYRNARKKVRTAEKDRKLLGKAVREDITLYEYRTGIKTNQKQ